MIGKLRKGNTFELCDHERHVNDRAGLIAAFNQRVVTPFFRFDAVKLYSHIRISFACSGQYRGGRVCRAYITPWCVCE